MSMGTGVDIGSLFGGLQSTLEGAIGSAAPIALAVGGLVLGIGLAWKLVKRFTGR